MQVVVVDDEENVRAFSKRALERAGHVVRECAGGTELMALIKETPPDVVVTDLFMPDVDGYELLRMLRTECPTVAVIVMSGGRGLVDVDHLAIARMLRATAVLQKPFTGAMLRDAVSLATSAE